MANIPHLVMFFAVGAGISENTSTFLVKGTMFGRDDSSKYCMMSTRLPQGSFISYAATSVFLSIVTSWSICPVTIQHFFPIQISDCLVFEESRRARVVPPTEKGNGAANQTYSISLTPSSSSFPMLPSSPFFSLLCWASRLRLRFRSPSFHPSAVS